MWKILDANIKAINEKGHVRIFSASDVTISFEKEKPVVIKKKQEEQPKPEKKSIFTSPLKSKKAKKKIK